MIIMTIAGIILRGALKLGKKAILGVAAPIVAPIQANIQNAEGGDGKLDYIQLIFSLATVIGGAFLIHGFLTGKFSEEAIHKAIELFKIIAGIL